MSFDNFVKERVYLKASPRTVEWYRESFKWLGLENPSKTDLTDFVIRMREKGLSSASCNNRIRAVNAYLTWRGSRFAYIINSCCLRMGLAMNFSPRRFESSK